MFTVNGPHISGIDNIFTPAACEFLDELHRVFYARRRELLAARNASRGGFENGDLPTFDPATSDIRSGDWKVVGTSGAPGLKRRVVELATPVEPREAAKSCNSDADVWMADLEDGMAPTWSNMVTAHECLMRAARGDFAFQSRSGKTFKARNPHPPTMVLRPRGWNLTEDHLTWTDATGRAHPASATLVDFGLFVFHNSRPLLKRNHGPYFYLPKVENRHEARLWNSLFEHAQEALGFARGTIRATVLIESVTAAFQMDEILYELRDHAVGLAAGRWDYVGSLVTHFGLREGFTVPQRDEIRSDSPFIRAFTDLLVSTCHRRGAQALGGLSTAVVESAHLPVAEPHERERVYEDKLAEVSAGFDGTWIAHRSLIDVVRAAYGKARADRVAVPPAEVVATDRVDLTEQLLTVPAGVISEEGVRWNLRVCLHYINAWLRGVGSVGYDGYVEDASTAELARLQLWQWTRQGVTLEGGRMLSQALVTRFLVEELAVLPRTNADHFDEAEDFIHSALRSEGAPEPFYPIAYRDHMVFRGTGALAGGAGFGVAAGGAGAGRARGGAAASGVANAA